MENTKIKKDYFNLDHLPKIYEESKDAARVAEEIWPFLMRMPRLFTTSIDIKSDFLLHFYERLPLFFQTYQRYAQSPFTPFLIRYAKNLFNNFIRHYRRRQLKESRYCETFRERSEEDPFYKQDKVETNTLSHLALGHRMIAKLYLGIELDLEELKFLVETTNSPQKVADFLLERRQRKEREYEKARCEKMYKDDRSIRELTHLARLFSVSKSTIHRRLEVSARRLYQLQK